MSRFFNGDLSALSAYVPGEQPKDAEFIKLNTNESPYPPSAGVLKAAEEEAKKLRLYSDPDGRNLRKALAENYEVRPENIVLGNGSDEILSFCFQAFGGSGAEFIFPDITYGFYPVFAKLYGVKFSEMPLDERLFINPDDYIGKNKNIIIANPNAPSGIYMELDIIEKIAATNPDNVVIIDEAYIDFGGESAAKLINKYDNLIVVQTFSKSRSLAGARLGYAITNSALADDLNKIRCSTNPYNVNRITLAAGEAAIREQDYYDENCKKIIETREWTKEKLKALNFSFPESFANFIFAKRDGAKGAFLYNELRKRKILVRHFNNEKISDYLRITVGSREEMEALICALSDIIKEGDELK